MTTIKIIFPKPQGVIAKLVAVATRRPGQKLPEVPAHVYVLVDDSNQELLYEAISSGVHRTLPVTEKDCPTLYSFDITLQLDTNQSQTYLISKLNDKYGWNEIAAKWASVNFNNILRLMRIPFRLAIKPTNNQRSEICSVYAYNAIKRGAEYKNYVLGFRGFNIDFWLDKSGNDAGSPVSPNDLALALNAWKNQGNK